MTKKSLILSFIKQFQELNATECFSNGMCYWFAHILTHRFHGYIVYNQVEDHFAASIDGELFDIKGEILDTKGYSLWPSADRLLNKRVERDCIFKLRPDEKACINCNDCYYDEFGCFRCSLLDTPIDIDGACLVM